MLHHARVPRLRVVPRHRGLAFVLSILITLPVILVLGSSPAMADLECVELCTENPAPPEAPSNCAESCIPSNEIHPKVSITGVVTDKRGIPVEGVDVFWTYGHVLTNASGLYSVQVWADKPVELVADHALFEHKKVTIDNPLTAAPFPQNLSLAYLLNTKFTPDAFNNSTPTTVTSITYTSAPPSAARVWSEFLQKTPSGLDPHIAVWMEYQPLTTDPPGWYRFEMTMTIGSFWEPGEWYSQSCALDAMSQDICWSATEDIISQVKGQPFFIDVTAPALRAVRPLPDRNTYDTSPTIEVAVADGLSGIDLARTNIYLDGNLLTSGTTVYYRTPILSPGVHTIRATTSDRAGNMTEVSWTFNVMTFQFDDVLATMEPQTKQVNPNTALPPPSSVTFNNLQFDLGSYGVTATATPYPGYGEFQRSLWYPTAEVVFDNGTGVQATRSVSLPSVFFRTGKLGILAPTNAESHLRIDSSSASSSISVQVPTGYNTPNSRATLSLTPRTLGKYHYQMCVEGACQWPYFFDPFPLAFPRGIDPPVIGITAQSSVRVAEQDGTLTVSEAPGTVHLRYFYGYQDPIELFSGIISENAFSSDPTIRCGGIDQLTPSQNPKIDGIRCLATQTRLSLAWNRIGLGTLGGVYATHRLYRDSDFSIYSSWDQVSAGVHPSSCVNGRRLLPELGRMTSVTTQPLLGPSGQSAWTLANDVHSTGGSLSGGSFTTAPELYWDTGDSVRNSATRSEASSVRALPSGELGPVSTGTQWIFDPDHDGAISDRNGDGMPDNGIRDSLEQLIVGAAFSNPVVAGSPIEILHQEEWSVVVEDEAC